MLLAIHGGILHIFIDDMGKTETVLRHHLLGTQHTMVETELERFFLYWRPQYLIITIFLTSNVSIGALKPIAERRLPSNG